MTATELSKKLGISRATIFRLKRQYPDSVPQLDKVEKWRTFALSKTTNADAICRLAK